MAAAKATLPQTQMAIDPKDRPRYTQGQLRKYFERIGLPQKFQHDDLFKDPKLALIKEHGLPFLTALTRYHVCNVPFENLELHYSAHKTISLDMDDLFDKFVDGGIKYGRGGRCMENNGFFGTVLRSLGFDVRNAGGRVSRSMAADTETREKQGQTYDGWNHMLNLVRLSGQLYVVDVGMGAMGPLIPYPLKDGLEMVSVAPRKIRLQYRTIPEHASLDESQAQKLWCYDVCHKPASPTSSSVEDKWIPTYAFTETEFLPQDYEMMSWFTSTSKKSFFTYCVLTTKLLMDEGGENIVGDRTLFGNGIRETIGGKREVVRDLKTEQERIEALEQLFRIQLTDEERAGISKDMSVQTTE